jgi:hypothetical protein
VNRHSRSLLFSYALVTCASGALLLACAAPSGPGGSGKSGGRPDWVRAKPGEMSDFPPDEYVTAVGTGQSDETARASARAEISQIFMSKIQSDLRDSSEVTSREQNGRMDVQVTAKLNIETRVTSSGTFEGVFIAEMWHDKSAGTHYALAVLDKAKTRSVLLRQLRDAADRAHGALSRADTAPTYLGRGQALIDAARASAEVDEIVARARVVGRPHVTGLPGTGVVERDLEETLFNTRFQVRAVEVDAGSGAVRGGLQKLQEELEKTITGIGFKVVRAGSSAGSPNVWLECRMSLQDVDRGLDTKFVRWEGAFELTGAPPNGAVILSSKSSGGESFSSASLARTRAIMKGSAKLSRELKRQIARYLAESRGH